MSILVMKFGGTSVGSTKAIQHVLEIVQQERPHWEHIVIVTSAIRGVTDSLVSLVNHACKVDKDAVQKQLETLRQQHCAAAREFIDPTQHPTEIELLDTQIDTLLGELVTICEEIAVSKAADGRLRDGSLSMGERLMAPILAAILRVNDIPAEKVNANEIIVTDTRHQNAQPQFELSRVKAAQIIHPLLEAGKVPVVTGYIGATPEGVITTLGRGGSDYSATYLASLIDADDVWIWTDVNGVMSADPRIIKQAVVMPSISYEEVSEFAHFGAKVLHPRSMEPLISPQIPLRVCNTFEPSHPGTRIVGQQTGGPKQLSAVTSINGILVFIPSNNHDVMLQLTQEVLEQQFSQEARPVITVNSHAGRLLCYVVPTTARRTAMEEGVALLQTIFKEHYPHVNWRVEAIAIVAAIGVVDIQQTVQVLNAVKSVKADLLAMGHGSPQCCLLAVPHQQALRVMRRLHRMILSVQANLMYAENDPLCPPMLSVPASRRSSKKNNRRGRASNPPHRVIPL